MYVKYRGYNMWHTRILLDQIEDHEWVVVTPDGDIYPEVLDASHPDVTEVKIGRGGRVPHGCAPLHPFPGRVGAAQMRAWLEEGEAIGAEERRARGIDPEPRRPAAVLPLRPAPMAVGALVPRPEPGAVTPRAVDPADAHRRWRLLERVGDLQFGDLVVPSGNLIALENRGVDTLHGRVVALAVSPSDETKEGFFVTGWCTQAVRGSGRSSR